MTILTIGILIIIFLSSSPVGGGESHFSQGSDRINNSNNYKAGQNKHLRDFSSLPEEPDEFDNREVKAYYDWRNDLFFREFDMNGTGTANYRTARRTYRVWLDEFGTPIVITVGAPLFYWLDLDGNGEFESNKGEMWSDPNEDGITGDERFYDSSDLQSSPSRIPLWKAPTP